MLPVEYSWVPDGTMCDVSVALNEGEGLVTVIVNRSDQVPVKVEQRVKEYVRCRDAIKALEEKHTKEKAPLVELQNMLTGWLQSFLETAGGDSIKTKEGTCYSTTKFTASLKDPDAFMKYVIDRQDFDLLDRKANVTAVKAHVAEYGDLPPGVNLSSIKTVGVRRASGS